MSKEERQRHEQDKNSCTFYKRAPSHPHMAQAQYNGGHENACFTIFPHPAS